MAWCVGLLGGNAGAGRGGDVIPRALVGRGQSSALGPVEPAGSGRLFFCRASVRRILGLGGEEFHCPSGQVLLQSCEEERQDMQRLSVGALPLLIVEVAGVAPPFLLVLWVALHQA
eukprot:7030792-Pyramimonas_sp.AAC.1